MECGWTFIDWQLPDKTGEYLVIRSEPYSETISIGSSYFNLDAGRFLDNPSGANEILYWLSGVDEVPNLAREGLRTRRVQK